MGMVRWGKGGAMMLVLRIRSLYIVKKGKTMGRELKKQNVKDANRSQYLIHWIKCPHPYPPIDLA